MTQRTLTISYDDADVHNTLSVASDDPTHKHLGDGIIYTICPSPSGNPNNAAISILNVGDLTLAQVSNYTLNLANHVADRIESYL